MSLMTYTFVKRPLHVNGLKNSQVLFIALAALFAWPMEGIQAQRGRAMHQALPAPQVFERALQRLTPIQIEEFQEAYQKMSKGGANARGLNVLRNKRKHNLSSDLMKIKANTEKGALLYQLLYRSKSTQNIEAIFKALANLPVETMYEASLESYPPKVRKPSLSKTEKRRLYQKRKEEEREAADAKMSPAHRKRTPIAMEPSQIRDRHAHLDLGDDTSSKPQTRDHHAHLDLAPLGRKKLIPPPAAKRSPVAIDLPQKNDRHAHLDLAR